ncbi:MAG: fumarate hydratase C-terminal domain-containing protein [Butyrivibrio sp.]|uniref:fumarate hydratase C-terminal domain-containing protein n=1 Tax=Butyrivibrio sp. TaxID=28121 RepID=UPI0025F5D39B|nr:fumarate hydratase C-terminal domain-containing protein [Butyrivibrio sp.]MCR5771481.1 fumarate hydratase C-terminal domain-containing protein [Butyrivibrio sp.]
MDYHITLPFTDEALGRIKPMDVLYLTGTVYTARDAAHKRLYETILEKLGREDGSAGLPIEMTDDEKSKILKELPFDLKGAVIYYLGPTPAKPGQVIGSAGPTTSGRMDRYTPLLLDLGLTGMIGKGRRSEAVTESIYRNNAIYMGATGGAGALLSKCIKSSEIIAYEDLGTEAIRKLYVENFPVTVLIK